MLIYIRISVYIPMCIYTHMYILPMNFHPGQTLSRDRIKPLVPFMFACMLYFLSVLPCGQQCICIFWAGVCVPIGNPCAAVLWAGHGDTELQQLHFYWTSR